MLSVLPRRGAIQRRSSFCWRTILSSLSLFHTTTTCANSMTTDAVSTPPSSTTPTTAAAIVGVAQLRATNDKLHNLMEIAKCAAWAKQRQASMLFLPENCGFMGAEPGETLAHAEAPVNEEKANPADVTTALQTMYKQTLNGETPQQSSSSTTTEKAESSISSNTISLLDGLKTLARTSRLWISVGGMHVLGAPPHPETGQTRFYNTHVVLDDAGTTRAAYRKIHLFDVQIPGQVNLMESNSTAAGRDIVVCDTPVGTLPAKLQGSVLYSIEKVSHVENLRRTVGSVDML